MRGFVYTGKDRVELMEMPIPVPREGEVVIKIAGCGVCGTDVHIYHGEVPLARPPVILGHEITGTVHEIGAGVKDLREGQTVCLDPVLPCLACDYCHNGRYNLCQNQVVLGYQVAGGFGDYTVAPRRNVYSLDPRVGVKGGVIVEPLACVLNGFDRLAPQAGRNALILGAGPIGLIWTQLLADSPLTSITQTDRIGQRCQKARQLGAHNVLDISRERLSEFVQDRFTEGFDYVIDASGDPQAIEEGVRYVRPGGTFMVFGVAPADSRCNIDPYLIFSREIKIIGAKMPPLTMDRAVRLVESGRIDYNTIISEAFPLEKLPETFTLFEEGRDRVLKMAITPA